jgi:predicted deacylase
MKYGFPTTPDFDTQRSRFLAAAYTAGASVTTYDHPLKGPKGEALATDVAWLGCADAPRVLVVLSGTHGVEGYYGSTCQTEWLRELAGAPVPDNVAILFVHLINPHGTAWVRRVNEDNVDLNRNYVDFASALPQNPHYEPLHSIYTARDIDGPERRRADAHLADAIAGSSWSAVNAIVGAGQYVHHDGLFFGGRQPTWSNHTLRAIVERFIAPAKAAIVFDLHTGAGPFGHPMLMTIAQTPYAALDDAKRLFGAWLYTLVTRSDAPVSDTGVVARATGYTSQMLIDSLPRTWLMPLVIECGTYPEAQMHTALRDDHWLYLYGDPHDARGREITKRLFESFMPGDADWRALAWFRAHQIWTLALASLPLLTVLRARQK